MEGENEQPRAKTGRKHWLVFGAIVLLAFGIGILAAQFFGQPGVTIPKAIAQKVDFPTYLPHKLPGNFQIVTTSFTFQENTLFFNAKDSTGATITFSEQKRKSNFDFTSFYNSQVKDAKNLSNTTFPSVVGTAKTGQARLLSVVTDETWVFVSTPAPLSQEDMEIIANALRRAN